MAKRFDAKARKEELDRYRADDPGSAIWSLGVSGDPLNGTAASDFLLAQQAGSINGLGGDDLILGDIGSFRGSPLFNTTFGGATDLDIPASIWSTDENPLVADASVPHATVYVSGEAGTQEYFKIVVGAGQTLTIDIDAAGGTLGSSTANTDTVAHLYTASDLALPIASNLDSPIAAGGYGSSSTLDAFLVFTNTGAAAATYFIRILELLDDDNPGAVFDNNFEADDEFLLNVSLTGHAVAAQPGQGNDTIDGGEGNDHLFGAAGGDILIGGEGADLLHGGSGNDFLVGGTGVDVMVGGIGDDTYYIDSTSDAISEFAGQGFDRVAASITLALAADADIERLDVEDLTSANALDLTGSGIANVIYGNDGINILRGEAGNDELRGFGGNDFLVGGGGTDLMVGGAGNDTFYVDDASDAIGEIAGEGNDRIAAGVSFVLSNGANVELLEAVNLLATTAFDLTGSDSNNTITGNNGVNILRGEGGNDILSSAGGDDFLVGGSGMDSMTGGAGNDTYYVDDGADVVNEIAGEGGADRVAVSGGFYALSANADIENLEAATQSSTIAMNLFGSSIVNNILGNDGVNNLDGKGGSDVLTGFGGADSFTFSTALGAGNVDTIIGFVSGSDKIRLENSVFAGLAAGALPAGAFVIGSQAQDADDRIVYNSGTGQLFFDADGNGAGAAMLFAILSGAPALAASDFLVVTPV